jgi:hypothetical protein
LRGFAHQPQRLIQPQVLAAEIEAEFKRLEDAEAILSRLEVESVKTMVGEGEAAGLVGGRAGR